MLEVIDLFKSYSVKKGERVIALDHVNLTFSETGLVFILGRSGAGKSTFLNVLGGLDRADSGEIRIDDRSSKEFRDADFDACRNSYLGFVFQEYHLLSEYSVRGNLELALSLQGKASDPSLIAQTLGAVDLSGYEERKVNELSGGQRQRVAIARALIKNPKVILADEPTGALDSESSIEVFRLLQRLAKEKLVIVVSHDQDFAKTYGDRIITFKDGKVVKDETLHEVQKCSQNPSQLILEKAHLRWNNSLKIALSSSFAKPVKLVVSILLTSIAFTFLGVAASAARLDEEASGIDALNYTHSNYVHIEKEATQLNDDPGSYYLFSMPLGEQDLQSLEAKTGLHFEGRIKKNKIPLQNNYAESLTGTLYYYPTEIKDFYPIDVLPKEFDLVSGRLPQKENEACITLRELEGFQHFGYQIYDVKKQSDVVTPGQEITKETILGKALTGNGASPLYTIVGVLDTHFDSASFASLKVADDGDKTAKKDIKSSLVSTLENRDENSFDDLLFTLRKAKPSYTRNNRFYLHYFTAAVALSDPNTNRMATYNAGHEFLPDQPFVFAQSKNKLETNEVLVSPNDFVKFLPTEPIAMSSSILSRYSALANEGNRLYATSDDPKPFGELPQTTQDLFPRFRLYETLAFAQEHLSEAEQENFPFNLYGSSAQNATSDDHLRAFHNFVWQTCMAEEPSENQDLIAPWRKAFIPFFNDKITAAIQGHEDVIYQGLSATLSMNENDVTNRIEGIKVVGFYFPTGDFRNGDITAGCLIISDELADLYLPYRFDYFDSALAYLPLGGDAEKQIVADFFARSGRHVSGVAYSVKSDALTCVSNAKQVDRSYGILFLIIGGVMLFFAILLFASLIASSINSRQKEIGILRALGARSKDIFLIYGLESLIVAFLCAIFSCLATFLATSAINRAFMSVIYPVSYFNCDGLVVLLLFASAILTAFLSSFVPAYHSAKKPPVEAIRSL